MTFWDSSISIFNLEKANLHTLILLLYFLLKDVYLLFVYFVFYHEVPVICQTLYQVLFAAKKNTTWIPVSYILVKEVNKQWLIHSEKERCCIFVHFLCGFNACHTIFSIMVKEGLAEKVIFEKDLMKRRERSYAIV